jgi:hypothetical protein
MWLIENDQNELLQLKFLLYKKYNNHIILLIAINSKAYMQFVQVKSNILTFRPISV